jgi:DNA-binding FrmR family transcriptional regulator
MWKAPEPTERSLDLRRLLASFRAQELSMIAALVSLQNELEGWHRESSVRQRRGDGVVFMVQRCTDLQAECDQIAVDLTHVRMAIAGVSEELAEHEAMSTASQRRHATPA